MFGIITGRGIGPVSFTLRNVHVGTYDDGGMKRIAAPALLLDGLHSESSVTLDGGVIIRTALQQSTNILSNLDGSLASSSSVLHVVFVDTTPSSTGSLNMDSVRFDGDLSSAAIYAAGVPLLNITKVQVNRCGCADRACTRFQVYNNVSSAQSIQLDYGPTLSQLGCSSGQPGEQNSTALWLDVPLWFGNQMADGSLARISANILVGAHVGLRVVGPELDPYRPIFVSAASDAVVIAGQRFSVNSTSIARALSLLNPSISGQGFQDVVLGDNDAAIRANPLRTQTLYCTDGCPMTDKAYVLRITLIVAASLLASCLLWATAGGGLACLLRTKRTEDDVDELLLQRDAQQR
jgi:hypothetical protein